MKTSSIAILAIAGLLSFAACDEEYAQYESSGSSTTQQATTKPAQSQPAEASRPAETHKPDPWTNQWLSWNGYGPVQLGMTYEELKAKGLARMDDTCGAPRPTEEVEDKGLFFYINPGQKLNNLSVIKGDASFANGTKLGTSEEELKSIQGDKLKVLPAGVETFGQKGYYVEQDGRVLVFILDKGKVTMMQLIDGKVTDFSPVEGC